LSQQHRATSESFFAILLVTGQETGIGCARIFSLVAKSNCALPPVFRQVSGFRPTKNRKCSRTAAAAAPTASIGEYRLYLIHDPLVANWQQNTKTTLSQKMERTKNILYHSFFVLGT